MRNIDVRVEAIIFNKDNEILLALHNKYNMHYWVMPGGILNTGEKMDDGIYRKLKEILDINHPEVKELLYADEFIDNGKDMHAIKIGFHVDVSDEELDSLKVMTEVDVITDVRFFNMRDLESTEDIFFPSRQFFTKLLEPRNE